MKHPPYLQKFINNLKPSDIPRGFCQCGCGLTTGLSRQNEAKRNYTRNKPQRYAYHHNRGTAKANTPFYVIDPLTGCWVWQRSRNADGYGGVVIRRRTWKAHALYYFLYKGLPPAKSHIDHLCRNRACVNPQHLEATTIQENIRRGAVTKLTIDAVRQIRSMYAEKRGGYRTIGRLFGVSGPQVRKIVKGLAWSQT